MARSSHATLALFPESIPQYEFWLKSRGPGRAGTLSGNSQPTDLDITCRADLSRKTAHPFWGSRWALGFGFCGLVAGLAQGEVQAFTVSAALICSRFIVRDTWRSRQKWPRGKFAFNYVLAWASVAAALVGIVRVWGLA